MITSLDKAPRNVLAVLEGSPRNESVLGSGLFEVGGFFDNLLSIVRTDLQEVVVRAYGFLRDRAILGNLTERQIEAILFAYSDGVKAGTYQPFGGSGDPSAALISSGVAKSTGYTQEVVFNVLFALKSLTDGGDTKASTILGGTGLSFPDQLTNTGPVGALANVAHNALDDLVKGLGLPVEFVTIGLYVGIAVAMTYVYKSSKGMFARKRISA